MPTRSEIARQDLQDTLDKFSKDPIVANLSEDGLLQSLYDDVRYLIETLEDDISEHENVSESLARDVSNSTITIETLKDEIENLKDELREVNDKNATLMDNMKSCQNLIIEKETEIFKLDKQIVSLETEIEVIYKTFV